MRSAVIGGCVAKQARARVADLDVLHVCGSTNAGLRRGVRDATVQVVADGIRYFADALIEK
jgi:hypothetical protein